MPEHTNIPEKAVEAAARATVRQTRLDRWEDLDDRERDLFMRMARTALSVALPSLLASRDGSDALQVIDERDSAEEWADRLAYAIAPVEVIGEHSSGNNPWQNALDHLASRDSETAEVVTEYGVRIGDEDHVTWYGPNPDMAANGAAASKHPATVVQRTVTTSVWAAASLRGER